MSILNNINLLSLMQLKTDVKDSHFHRSFFPTNIIDHISSGENTKK